jgi:hypothetical protein
MLRETTAGGLDPIGYSATFPNTPQSCCTSILKGPFNQGDRTISGHFPGSYQVEASTRKNSVTWIRTRRGRQIAYQRQAHLAKTASVSKNSDNDIKAPPTRRKGKNGSSSDLIGHKVVSAKIIVPTWKRTIHLAARN